LTRVPIPRTEVTLLLAALLALVRLLAAMVAVTLVKRSGLAVLRLSRTLVPRLLDTSMFVFVSLLVSKSVPRLFPAQSSTAQFRAPPARLFAVSVFKDPNRSSAFRSRVPAVRLFAGFRSRVPSVLSPALSK